MLLDKLESNALRTGIYLFWLAVFVLTLLASLEYQGQTLVYLLFTIVANTMLYFGFRKNAIFFDTFIGILLWLGFWLKSTVRIAFLEGAFLQPTGSFDGSASSFDQVLVISSCGLAGFVAASLFREKFIFRYPERDNVISLQGLFNFYQKWRFWVLAAFAFLFIITACTNVWFGIYQRGEVPRTVLPYGLSGIYAWLLQFGFASVSATILYFEFVLKKGTSLTVPILAMLETFLSSVSLLSRGMILNGGALFYGALKSLRTYSLKSSIRFLMVVLILFGSLFVSSVFLVNHLRASDGPVALDVGEIAENNSLTKLSDLVLDRWVGIEGVMAVFSYSGGLGWDLWNTAWSEPFDVHQTSFFDQNMITSPYRNMDTSKYHYVSLPGIVAFCFYPGSYPFLFASVFLVGLLAALIEISAYKLGGRNVILCALIAQVVAYRLMSFGYVPAQSYKLFGTIYLNLILIYAANWVLQYFGTKQVTQENSGTE